MTVERDIAGFVLPFTLGTALALSFQHANIHAIPHISSTAFLITATCLATLLCRRILRLNSVAIWATIIISGFCCGILCCGMTHPYFIVHICDEGPIFRAAQNFGQSIKHILAEIQFADNRTNALATALITGDRSSLTSEDINIFRSSGASHILALSGMHLGIIYGILKIILSGIGNSLSARRSKSCIIILICGFYTLSTGAGPSIVRALIFIILAETANLSGRRTNLKGTLLTALLIQLFLTPGDIADVGFQLSYAAMAGIAFIFPWLKNLWPQEKTGVSEKILKWIWSSAALSIACQITTAPIAFVYFGTFPKYFLITNLLAIPLVGIIIPTLVLTATLGFCGTCPEILVQITEILTKTLIHALTIISSL